MDQNTLRNRIPINSSSIVVYQYISTPSGLSEWFADNVNSRGEFLLYLE
jgi:hypothetical protein